MRIPKRCLSIGLMLLFCILLFLSSIATSQTIKGFLQTEREQNDVKKLLNILDEGKLSTASQYFFGNIYDDELPNLVVFVDNSENYLASDSNVRIALVKAAQIKDHLFGEPFIYVMVFVAEDTANKIGTEKPKKPYKRVQKKTSYKILTDSMRVFVDTAQQEIFVPSETRSVVLCPLDRRMGSGEFALLSVVKMLSSAILGGTFAGWEEGVSPQDTSFSLEIDSVGYYDSTCLYFGRAKIPLEENTIDRIRIKGLGTKMPQATFGNYSPSWVTSSIGIMETFLDKKTSKQEGVHQTLVKPHIFGHLYLKRPQRPKPRLNNPCTEFLRKTSVSFVFGTRLSTDDLFDDLFIGIGWGHWMSTFGFVSGVNFRTSEINRSKRKGHFAVGMTFML